MNVPAATDVADGENTLFWTEMPTTAPAVSVNPTGEPLSPTARAVSVFTPAVPSVRTTDAMPLAPVVGFVDDTDPPFW